MNNERKKTKGKPKENMKNYVSLTMQTLYIYLFYIFIRFLEIL